MTASSAQYALICLEQQADVLIIDWHQPAFDPLEFILTKVQGRVATVIVSADEKVGDFSSAPPTDSSLGHLIDYLRLDSNHRLSSSRSACPQNLPARPLSSQLCGSMFGGYHVSPAPIGCKKQSWSPKRAQPEQ